MDKSPEPHSDEIVLDEVGEVAEEGEGSFTTMLPHNMSAELAKLSQLQQSGVVFNDFMEKKFTALDLKDQYLKTGCPKIDAFMNGGIIRSGMTEFAGPAGVGKTQLALQLCIMAQLPEDLGGLNAGAVYINTESLFPSPRLASLCEHFKKKYGSKLPDNPMDNVLLKTALDTEALMNCVITEIPVICTERHVGLLIVDSVAATFRADYEENEALARANDLRILGRGLHDVAFRHNLVLVCLNQVSAAFGSPDPEHFNPALGMAWRSLVTHRIVMSKKEDGQRWMEVPFSSYIPMRTIPFQIGAEGIYSST